MKEGTQVYSQGRQKCVKVFTDELESLDLYRQEKEPWLYTKPSLSPLQMEFKAEQLY